MIFDFQSMPHPLTCTGYGTSICLLLFSTGQTAQRSLLQDSLISHNSKEEFLIMLYKDKIFMPAKENSPNSAGKRGNTMYENVSVNLVQIPLPSKDFCNFNSSINMKAGEKCVFV